MADLKIQLRVPKFEWAAGETLCLRYDVTNVSERDLFVVADAGRVYKLQEGDRLLRVILGQIRPEVAFDYFAFHPPKLRKLAAGAQMGATLSIGMPTCESRIAPSGVVELTEVELTGELEVRLEIGYGAPRFRARTLDPFGEFLMWQRFEVSPPILLHLRARAPVQSVAV